MNTVKFFESHMNAAGSMVITRLPCTPEEVKSLSTNVIADIVGFMTDPKTEFRENSGLQVNIFLAQAAVLLAHEKTNKKALSLDSFKGETVKNIEQVGEEEILIKTKNGFTLCIFVEGKFKPILGLAIHDDILKPIKAGV